MKKQQYKPYLIFLVAVCAVGGLGALAVKAGMPAYHALEKPWFTPPDFVFPIAWSILYVLMAIGAARVWNSHSRLRVGAVRLFALQLGMNGLWNLWFFALQWHWFAFFWLLALLAAIFAMIRAFSQVDRTAARLQLPYLLWTCFAAALNLGVALLN